MIRYKTTSVTSSTLPPLRDEGLPLLHHFRQFRANQLQFWLETGQMGPLMRVRFGPRELWVVTDAEMLREMLPHAAVRCSLGRVIIPVRAN